MYVFLFDITNADHIKKKISEYFSLIEIIEINLMRKKKKERFGRIQLNRFDKKCRNELNLQYKILSRMLVFVRIDFRISFFWVF